MNMLLLRKIMILVPKTIEIIWISAEYFLQPQPTATAGLRLKFISLILLVFLMITQFYKRTKES